MELIVINENKLKITLSAFDMQKYGLDENEFHLSISNTRNILSKILHNSPIKTGFEEEISNERLLLQLYPEKNGGCELYITRLSLDSNSFWEDEEMSSNDNNLLPQPTNISDESKKHTLCYSFSRLEDAINACKTLKSSSITPNASFFAGEDKTFYLFFEDKNELTNKKAMCFILSEFGSLENSEQCALKLSERGTKICSKNAITTLSRL